MTFYIEQGLFKQQVLPDDHVSVEHNIPEPQPELRESAAAVSVSAATSNWPPRVNDCVVGLFEDEFYPGEVFNIISYRRQC